MAKLFLVVEGLADETFLKQFIKCKFTDHNKDIEFIQVRTNGESIKRKRISQIIEKTIYLEEETVFILDADAPDYKGTLSSLIENFKNEDLDVSEDQFFLMPNNSDGGCMENLLLDIVSDQAEPIFSCFENYKNCIHQIDELYTKPDLKTKIFAYSEIITGSGNEKSRDYLNKGVWNLDHESLRPLFEFLKMYLQ